ncbi:MAG TPA: ankyrin repeat domain-containing protein [Spirochaetota bacterium]|nr:ankyrin repeat domain-containing protein [Spirochaetota bacterium]HOR45117.1 ankyrin repeat domain-containing protein [Spirochaetota bacterium]HPK56563.1 ankyrin repeat domain-containing protein [Spirochaetota bacterium]
MKKLIALLFIAATLSCNRNNQMDTDLYNALLKHDSDKVEFLLQSGSNSNAIYWPDTSILEVASKIGDIKSLNILIKYGANVNYKGHLDQTALHEAKNAAVAVSLIKNGANVNSFDSFNQTPLHKTKDIDIAKILLDNGADNNIKNIFEDTPLHIAVDQNNYELAKLLIARGADINIINQKGQKPIDIAIIKKNSKIVKLFNKNK